MLRLFRLVTGLLVLVSAASAHAQESSEWLAYENDDLSLAYPNTWKLTETERRITLSHEDFALEIFRDDLPMGLPAGDFERRKLIGPYGIPVDLLVYEGSIKQVLYARLERPDGTTVSLVLAVQSEPGAAYEDITIPLAVVDQASQIVSTLRLRAVQQPADMVVRPFFSGAHDPIDTWQTYSHPTEPFGFRYPGTWTLQEEAGRILLVREGARFTIVYAPITAQPPSVNPDLGNSDRLAVRASIHGLHQAIWSEVAGLQADGTAEGVIYDPVLTPDNHFVMWVNGDPLLDTATMDEVDLIISTFKTRPFHQSTQSN